MVIGFAWFVTFLADSDDPVVFTLGTALQNVYLLGFVYLVLSFPSGRLRGRLERILFLAAIVLTIVVEVAYLLFVDSTVFCSGCPENALQVVSNNGLGKRFSRASGLRDSSFRSLRPRCWLIAGGVRVLPQRRAVSPLLWTGGAMFAALRSRLANDIVGEPLSPLPTWTRAFVFAAIPVAVLAVMLQRRLARGAVAGLVVELQSGTATVELRDALGRALGDSSLELAYWLPGQGRYVDSDGRPVELPRGDTGRVATVVERDGEPVAALVHDVALRENGADRLRLRCRRAHARERAAAGGAARQARGAAGIARAAGGSDGHRAAADRARPARRHTAAARLDRDGSRPRRVEARVGSPAVGPVLREARDALALALEELRDLTQNSARDPGGTRAAGRARRPQ